MVFGRLPTGDQIAQEWAPRTATRGELPRLIQLLLIHTAKPQRLEIRAGGGTGAPGWDAIVESAMGNAWVPPGLSLWEFGAGEDPADKAQRDYRNRTKDDALEDERRKATFVFVTPHRWNRKDEWVDRKIKEGKWAGIVVLDADSLENWLRTCVYAHIWLEEQIHGSLPGVETLGHWWKVWARNFPGVVLPPSVALVSRSEAADRVRGWVSAAGTYHAVRSTSSSEEVIALVAATIQEGHGTPDDLDRAVVVRDQDAWRHLILSEQPLILVPTYLGVDVTGAIEARHVVIEPLPRDRVGQYEIELPARKTSEFRDALVTAGLRSEDAARLAPEARDDFEVLRRGLGGAGIVAASWARAEAARFLVPALLIGEWNQRSEADRAALERLSGMDYEALEREYTALAGSAEPVVKRRGEIWLVATPVDVWRQLQRFFTDAVWSRFISLATEVLTEPDPAWELPPEERYLAELKGKKPAHSDGLRHGIARTLAMAASVPDFAQLPGGRTGPQVAGLVVRAVLGEANKDVSGGRWVALSEQLPLLAEAAPDVFLEALHVGASGTEPVLRPLFDEQPGLLMPQSNHHHLLWALERLSWSQDYLAAAAKALARLAELDPGGSTSNRPLASLQEIFTLYRPRTSAKLDRRREVLNSLRRDHPGIAWDVLLKILPEPGQILMETSKPEWRRWTSDEPDVATWGDVFEAAAPVVAWLIEDAADDPDRWAAMVDVATRRSLSATIEDSIMAALDILPPDGFSITGLETISKSLRDIVGRHRAYSDESWAMDSEWVDRLAAIAERFDPPDPVVRHRWLFEAWPTLERIRGESHNERETRLADERRVAIGEILDAKGWDGIVELVHMAQSPEQVGRALARWDKRPEDDVLKWADAGDEREVVAMLGYSAARGWIEGSEWTESVARAHAGEWPPERMARFLLTDREDRHGWNLAADLGPDVERAYWERFHHFPDGDDLWIAVEKLIAFDQPFVAIDVAGIAGRAGKDVGPNLDLTYATLDAAAKAKEPAAPAIMAGLQYDIAQLFKMLDEGGFDRDQLASLEWVFLLALEHSEYEPKHIMKRLVSDPPFFVEVIKIVFMTEKESEAKKAGEERPASDPEALRYAEHAYRMLSALRRSPGATDDGGMDGAALREWVDQARELLRDADRATIGDQRIGHALWYAPPGDDGLHPHEAVRQLIEDLGSDELELGYHVEAMNSRGAHFRRGDGGEEEREIARGWEARANAVASRWPRTAAVFRGIADDYRTLAERWDNEARLREDKWS